MIFHQLSAVAKAIGKVLSPVGPDGHDDPLTDRPDQIGYWSPGDLLVGEPMTNSFYLGANRKPHNTIREGNNIGLIISIDLTRETITVSWQDGHVVDYLVCWISPLGVHRIKQL